MKYSFFIAAIFLFSACTIPPKEVNVDAEKEIILKNVAAFSKHVMNGDAKAIAAAYTTDGKIFPENQDIMEGSQVLEKYWTPSPFYKTTYHKVTPSEIKILGNEAYDYGYYEGESLKLSDNTTSKWRGKYVIVWKKIEGDWKIYLDIWNSISS